MTFKELIQDLAAKFFKVGVYTKAQNPNGVLMEVTTDAEGLQVLQPIEVEGANGNPCYKVPDKTGNIQLVETEKFKSRDTEFLVRQAEGVEWLQVGVYEQQADNGLLLRRNIHVYVMDRGKPAETAWVKDKPVEQQTLPGPKQATPFTDGLEALIDNKVEAGTILAGTVLEVSEQRRMAKVQAYLPGQTAGDATEAVFLVHLDDNNKPQFKRLG